MSHAFILIECDSSQTEPSRGSFHLRVIIPQVKKRGIKQMFKSVFAATAALSMSAGAALAGPYVNVETNAGWVGDDYTGATTDFHVGYEGAIGDGDASWYVQGGPSVVAVDGAENQQVWSGKVGASAALSSSVGVYGELSAATADSDFSTEGLGVGGKLGVKYNF